MVTPRDTQELVEAVRETLKANGVYRYGKYERENTPGALAALAELAERLEAAELERDEYRNARRMMAADREALERDLASSQAAALLLHKRVEELEKSAKWLRENWINDVRRMEAAEAQLAERDKRVEELEQKLSLTNDDHDSMTEAAADLVQEQRAQLAERDKRIEGLERVRKAAQELIDHANLVADEEIVLDRALRALADPVVVPGWEWDFKQEC